MEDPRRSSPRRLVVRSASSLRGISFGASPFTPIVTQTISLVRFRVCLSPVRSSVGCVTLIQIREILNLPQLTPEEEARAREEHRWLFEDTN